MQALYNSQLVVHVARFYVCGRGAIKSQCNNCFQCLIKHFEGIKTALKLITPLEVTPQLGTITIRKQQLSRQNICIITRECFDAIKLE